MHRVAQFVRQRRKQRTAQHYQKAGDEENGRVLADSRHDTKLRAEAVPMKVASKVASLPRLNFHPHASPEEFLIARADFLTAVRRLPRYRQHN